MERLIREAVIASRFLLVGIMATAVHASVAFLVLKVLTASLAVANLVGFCIALCVSYVGHYYFTFRSGKGHGTSMVRFVMTALAAYLVNISVVSVLGIATDLQPELRLVAGIATMPAVTFVLSRLWVY